MKKWLGVAIIALLAAPLIARSVAYEAEEQAVREAALDYVEGVYEVAPARIERSVHPELRKLGFWRRNADDPYRSAPMTFEQLVNLAGNYNKDGRVPKDAVKEVVVLDVLDQTASVKLVAHWGIDYMHLAKYDGKWKIINVLWQSHPPK